MQPEIKSRSEIPQITNKKRRGRPKGPRNQPKPNKNLVMNKTLFADLTEGDVSQL